MGFLARKAGNTISMAGKGLKSVANGTKGLLDKAVNLFEYTRNTFKYLHGVAKHSLGVDSTVGEIYSMALGLAKHPGHKTSGLLRKFGDNINDTNVLNYWDIITKRGMNNAKPGKELEEQLLKFMTEAKDIHFNLDGMISKLDSTELKKILKKGALGTGVDGNITNWEFLQVWTNFKDKASFYFNGTKTDITNFMK